MRKVAIEILLIILISLFLSLVYNAVSPSGLRILPKKTEVRSESAINVSDGIIYI